MFFPLIVKRSNFTLFYAHTLQTMIKTIRSRRDISLRTGLLSKIHSLIQNGRTGNNPVSGTAVSLLLSHLRLARRLHTIRIEKLVDQIINRDELVKDLELRREQGGVQGVAGRYDFAVLPEEVGDDF